VLNKYSLLLAAIGGRILTYWKAVEQVGEGLPQLNAISSLALIIETINPENNGKHQPMVLLSISQSKLYCT
jgi:hypothetical protein